SGPAVGLPCNAHAVFAAAGWMRHDRSVMVRAQLTAVRTHACEQAGGGQQDRADIKFSNALVDGVGAAMYSGTCHSSLNPVAAPVCTRLGRSFVSLQG